MGDGKIWGVGGIVTILDSWTVRSGQTVQSDQGLHCLLLHLHLLKLYSVIEVIEKQLTGTGAIKRQIPLLKPKREINKYYI